VVSDVQSLVFCVVLCRLFLAFLSFSFVHRIDLNLMPHSFTRNNFTSSTRWPCSLFLLWKAGRNWLFIFCHIKHKLPWPTFYVEQFLNLIKSYQWNIMSCTLHFIIIKSCIYNTEISAFILLKCGTYNKFNMLVLRAVLIFPSSGSAEENCQRFSIVLLIWSHGGHLGCRARSLNKLLKEEDLKFTMSDLTKVLQ
jgi:hypothetical protein